MFVVIFLIGIAHLETSTILLIILDYIPLRIAFFDTWLNFFRGKPEDYKTTLGWVKWACAIVGVIVIPALTYIF